MSWQSLVVSTSGNETSLSSSTKFEDSDLVQFAPFLTDLVSLNASKALRFFNFLALAVVPLYSHVRLKNKR